MLRASGVSEYSQTEDHPARGGPPFVFVSRERWCQTRLEEAVPPGAPLRCAAFRTLPPFPASSLRENLSPAGPPASRERGSSRPGGSVSSSLFPLLSRFPVRCASNAGDRPRNSLFCGLWRGRYANSEGLSTEITYSARLAWMCLPNDGDRPRKLLFCALRRGRLA